MRGRGRSRCLLSIAGVVLAVAALTGAGVGPVPAPRSTIGELAADRAIVDAGAGVRAGVRASRRACERRRRDRCDRRGRAGPDRAAVLDGATVDVAIGAQGATPIAAASLTKLYTVVDVLGRGRPAGRPRCGVIPRITRAAATPSA
jgi:hypothetical protein